MFHSGREMSLVIKSNGHGTGSSVRRLKKKAIRMQVGSSSQTAKENEVTFQTADGVESRARVARLTRHAVTFEASNFAATLRTSQVLGNFKIATDNRVIYFGRAVVSNVIHTGESLLCEAKLDDLGSDTAYFLPAPGFDANPQEAYQIFFQTWQKNYRISNEFKVLVTDVQSYLTGVRHWLEELEFGLEEQADRMKLENEILNAVAAKIITAFNDQHERFEEIIYAL